MKDLLHAAGRGVTAQVLTLTSPPTYQRARHRVSGVQRRNASGVGPDIRFSIRSPGDAMNDSERIARRWFEEVWNQRNEGAIGTLMSEGCVGISVVGETRSARDWIEACYRPLVTTVPDLRITIDGVTATDDEVAVRWQATGTHQGDGLGIAPSGKPIHIRGLTWMRIRGGQIVEGQDGWDFGSLLRELSA